MSNTNGKEPLVTILPEKSKAYPLPDPASYTSKTSTMYDGGQSVSGKLLASVVREDVATVSLSWRYLTAQEWADINALFNGGIEGGSFINKVRFFNQSTGTWVEPRDMTVSDRSAGLWRQDENGNVAGWLDCSLELTEV